MQHWCLIGPSPWFETLKAKKKNIKYKRYLIFSLYKVELIIKYCNKIHKKLRPSSWQIKFNFFFLLLLLLKLLKLYVIGSFERFGLWPRAVIGVLFLEMEKKGILWDVSVQS